MNERKSIRDNISMVSGNLAKYLWRWESKNKLCLDGRWGKGPGRLVVQQMLLGLRPARYHDADRPTSLMDMMELQLDKFEASEETWV